MQVNNILIDDAAEDSDFFKTVVEQINSGIKVTVASCTGELLYHLQQNVPDLLFIDSYIQQDSGLVSIKELRANAYFKQLPIMYTGSGDKKKTSMLFRPMLPLIL